MSNQIHRAPGPPARPRPSGLDKTDRLILEILAADGRTSNAVLAARLGLAASTCLSRVRALRDKGIIRGFHAELDLARLGRPIQAMVAVRIAEHSRDRVDQFRTVAPRIPGVLAVYHVTGPVDYLLHVAVGDPAALRDLVLDHVVSLPMVAHAETSLIFEHVRGESPLA